MSCPESAPAPFACPTLEQSIVATAGLLPRGAAWPANDGGGLVTRFLQWLAGLTSPPAPNRWPAGYVQAGLIAAIGTVRNYVEAQWCALRLEFWCATRDTTADLWNAEYGLPDPCDPTADLCARVAATGGSTCDYFAKVAARAGWSIVCESEAAFCGFQCGAALAGNATAGGGRPTIGIVVEVILPLSPAYQGGPAAVQPLAGLMLAGMTLNCPPNINALSCLLERIMPAHVPVAYVLSSTSTPLPDVPFDDSDEFLWEVAAALF